jgi:hypothetical protein
MRDNWHRHRRCRPRDRSGDKLTFGIIIALLGTLLLMRTLHILPYFSIHHIWPFILIAIGVVIGIKNRFMNPGSWILIGIGVLNAIPEFTIAEQSSKRLVWPVLLIGTGLFIMLRSRKKKYYPGEVNTLKHSVDTSFNIGTEPTLNIDITFGARKEIVTSKDFKGGSISATFAGAEVNLMQADSPHPMALDIRVAFGGVELIVPSHWEVQNEISPALGSVEDHRIMRTPNSGDERRILILRGSCSFGSVELKSY